MSVTIYTKEKETCNSNLIILMASSYFAKGGRISGYTASFPSHGFRVHLRLISKGILPPVSLSFLIPFSPSSRKVEKAMREMGKTPTNTDRWGG